MFSLYYIIITFPFRKSILKLYHSIFQKELINSMACSYIVSILTVEIKKIFIFTRKIKSIFLLSSHPILFLITFCFTSDLLQLQTPYSAVFWTNSLQSFSYNFTDTSDRCFQFHLMRFPSNIHVKRCHQFQHHNPFHIPFRNRFYTVPSFSSLLNYSRKYQYKNFLKSHFQAVFLGSRVLSIEHISYQLFRRHS